MLETFPLHLFCVLSKLFFLSLSLSYYYYYFYTRLSSPFSPTLSLEYTRKRERIIPRNNNNGRNKKWWDSWKNPRFFEKKFDSIFFSSFFFEPREKSERFGQRERAKESREKERGRERKCEPDTCLCFAFNRPFFQGEKNLHFTYTYIYIYITTHTHIYIFKKKKTEMMASSQTLSFARAVAPSPRKLTRKSTLSFSNKRSSSIKISASSIPIHIEYCEK